MASRWLKSVNNLLDSLDGQAENVAEVNLPTSRQALNQVLEQRGFVVSSGDNDDDDTDEDYEDLDNNDDDNNEIEEEGGEEEKQTVVKDAESLVEEQQQTTTKESTTTKEDGATNQPTPTTAAASIVESDAPIAQDATEIPLSVSKKEDQEEDKEEEETPPPDLKKSDPPADDVPFTTTENAPAVAVATEEGTQRSATNDLASQQPVSAPLAKTETVASPPVSGNARGTREEVARLQQQIKKYKLDWKRSQTETRQLRKHVMQLNTALEASEAEVSAQRDELQRAGERLEKERTRANEEREDILDDHDEELEVQKEQYEKMLEDQKEQYEEQVGDWKDRFTRLEKQRAQEDGDWTKELEEAIQREREALKKLGQVREEKATLKTALARLEAQQSGLQTKLESSSQSIQTATERERQAEDKLDAALSLHSRQLSQRQAREAELERTVADLGAALATARQKDKNAALRAAQKPSDSTSFKEQLEAAVEELDTVRVQLTMESERCDALRQELNDISQERATEAAEAHANQRQRDRQVEDLRSTVTRLQSSLRKQKGARNLPPSAAEAEGARKQIESLSEQVIRHQRSVESYKTEMLALKNRLKTANQRAEKAEDALTAASAVSVYEVDSGGGLAYGGGTMRRRVKGGGRAKTQKSSMRVRSIRSALEMGPGHVSDNMEQVAATVDAVDSFLVETGGFLRQEPLARLAFFLYLCVLHLWSFCLVIFHASSYEEVHGDFGSMADPNVESAAAAVASPRLLRHSLQP